MVQAEAFRSGCNDCLEERRSLIRLIVLSHRPRINVRLQAITPFGMHDDIAVAREMRNVD